MIRVKGHNKNNGYKFVHTIVMEDFLGRTLLSNENVHHINGVKDDNRIENLELWTRPQPVGIRVKDAIEWALKITSLYEEETYKKKRPLPIPALKNTLTIKKVKRKNDKKGYIMCHWKDKSGKNRATFEHIIIMEKYLKRDLAPGENVHHINGIRNDNRIENLELWTRPQPTGIRASDALTWAQDILTRYKNI